MSLDNHLPDTDARPAEADPTLDVAAAEAPVDAAEVGEEEEADQVERAAQGLITIGLFLAFVTFVIFCLPMYFF